MDETEKKDDTEEVSDDSSKNNEEESNESGESSKEEKPEDLKKYYETELTREKERRERLEKKMADDAYQYRREKREIKKEEDETGNESNEEKPVTASELRGILAEQQERIRKEVMSEQTREYAKKLAGSDEEAALIAEVHRNRSFPSDMPLSEQVEEAYVIANRKRIMAQNEELRRALRAKGTASDDSTQTQRKSAAADEPKMPANDRQAIVRAGMVWDGQKRLFKKPLGGGKKHLFYDPKTKRRYVV